MSYFKGDLFVLVFNLDDIDSYMQMKKLCEQIMEIKKQKNHAKIYIPILIIGNKLDYILDNKIKNRCYNSADFEKFLTTIKTACYNETSCKNNIGLDRAFEKYFFQSNLPIEMIPSKHRKVSLNLDLTKPLFPKNSKNDEENCNNNSDNNNNNSQRSIRSKNTSFKRKKDSAGIQSENNSINSTSNVSANDQTLQPKSSFKNYARKSLRKMTFRRHLSEACGAVWLNARRPSIRAELNLLKIKTNLNIHLPMKKKNTDGSITTSTTTNSTSKSNTNKKDSNLFGRFLKLFACKKTAKKLL
jgi:hypothetical protein